MIFIYYKSNIHNLLNIADIDFKNSLVKYFNVWITDHTAFNVLAYSIESASRGAPPIPVDLSLGIAYPFDHRNWAFNRWSFF